jgi:hypothetical protein
MVEPSLVFELIGIVWMKPFLVRAKYQTVLEEGSGLFPR